MLKTNRIIITEGKYDKIKLNSIIKADIFITDGFSIFKDEKTKEMLKSLAKNRGAIIITDSDHAGFMIRKHLNDILNSCDVINIYIPDVIGKEKRKTSYSKEGKVGVEGIDPQMLKELIEKNVSFSELKNKNEITNLDLFNDGFIGKPGSKEKRKNLIKKLDLPENLSKNTLLKILNSQFNYEEYKKLVKSWFFPCF